MITRIAKFILHQWPLIGVAVPTLYIGFGLLIPSSCIAGTNSLTLGFAATVAGACIAYWIGTGLAKRGGGRHA